MTFMYELDPYLLDIVEMIRNNKALLDALTKYQATHIKLLSKSLIK